MISRRPVLSSYPIPPMHRPTLIRPIFLRISLHDLTNKPIPIQALVVEVIRVAGREPVEGRIIDIRYCIV